MRNTSMQEYASASRGNIGYRLAILVPLGRDAFIGVDDGDRVAFARSERRRRHAAKEGGRHAIGHIERLIEGV